MLESPKIVVRKSSRKLELYDGDELVDTFRIVLGTSSEGDKSIEGDGRTPEGLFYVSVKNPKSKFHLSLGISYPDERAATRGLAEGLITREEHDAIVQAISENRTPPQKTKLGGEIYIHGGGTQGDWTEGCVALDNTDMEKVFAYVQLGCPVTILA